MLGVDSAFKLSKRKKKSQVGDSDLYRRKVVTLVLIAWVLEEKPNLFAKQAPPISISRLHVG